MKYLIHTNGVGAIVDIPRGFTADEFGDLQKRFHTKYDDGTFYATMIKLHENWRACGVLFDWGLAGPDGAWFKLIRFPDVTADDIERAKNHLHRERDVVRLNVLKIARMVDFPLLATEGAR